MPVATASDEPPAPAAPPRRVLLIHPGALGDVVQALPAFCAIRARFPRTHLSLVTGDDLADVAGQLQLFDAVHTFNARVAYRGSAPARLRLLAGLATRIRRARPEVVAVFKGAPIYAALAFASGASVRAGLARGPTRALLTHPIAIDPGRHHADRYADVARALGASLDAAMTDPWPSPSAASQLLRPHARSEPVRARRPLVAVVPGGARNAKQDYAPKRWPAARFAEALLQAAEQHPIDVVLLGGPTDRGEADALLAALDGRLRVTDLVGRTSVVAARAVIAACDAYLGNDSGLMHVAGTTATPIVAVFGPTDPRVLAPRGPWVRTPWHPARSYPCVDEVTGAVHPCAATCCIDRVSAAEVATVLSGLLADATRDRLPATPPSPSAGVSAP